MRTPVFTGSCPALFFPFLNKKMGLKEVLGILGKMEVLEDESTEN